MIVGFSDLEYLSFLKEHRDAFTELRNETAAQVEIFKSEFAERLAGNEQAEALGIDVALACERVDAVTISYFEELCRPPDTFDGRSGDYNVGSHHVRLLLGLPPGKLRAIVFHELVHAISGSTNPEDPEELVPPSDRSGLRYSVSRVRQLGEGELATSIEEITDRFRWLSEAITEHVARLLRAGEHLSAYEDEHHLLRGLMKLGEKPLPLKLFTRPYFAQNEPARAAHGWRDLQQAVSEAYRPGFLYELDKVIADIGPLLTSVRLEDWRVRPLKQSRQLAA
jgi:hypothetical protein